MRLIALATVLAAAGVCAAHGEAPKWPWGMRAATFFCPTRLKVTDPELEDRIALLARLGYDTLVLGTEHFQVDFVSQWPEIEALTARITAVAHRHGLKVIEHHSAGAIHTDHLDEALDGHTLRDLCPVNARTGTFDRYIETLIFVCPNNPLHWQLYSGHARRLMTEACVDGFMADDMEILLDTHSCACQHCRARFRAEAGLELPPPEDRTFWGNHGNPGYRRWIRFRQRSVGDFHRRMRRLRDEVAPHVKLLACQCDPAGTALAVLWAAAHDEWAESLDVLFLEAMNAFGYVSDWAYHASNMKLLQAMGQGREPVLPLYYPLGAGHPNLVLFSSPEALERLRPNGRWDNGVGKVTGAYERAALARTEGHPGLEEHFFIHALSSMFADGHWVGENFDLAAPAFPFYRAHRDLFRRTGSVATIALHYSRQTRDFYAGVADSYHVEEWRGWATTLLQRNWPFDVVVDEDLARGLPESVRLLILPNSACLSDAQLAQTRRFVRRGGRVVATGDASLYTEDGTRRPDFALADLFGAHWVETRRGVVGAEMLPERCRESEAEAAWSIGRGLPASLVVADDVCLVRRAGARRAVGALRLGGSETPAGTLGPSGRVLYLAVKPGLLGAPGRPKRVDRERVRFCGPRDAGWHGLLAHCVRWGLQGALPVRIVNAPEGLILSAGRNGTRVVVQILNGTGAVRAPGAIYDPNACSFPEVRPAGSGSIQLCLRVPRRPARVMLLTPDCPEPERLTVRRRGSAWAVGLPAERIRRYALVVWETQR